MSRKDSVGMWQTVLEDQIREPWKLEMDEDNQLVILNGTQSWRTGYMN